MIKQYRKKPVVIDAMQYTGGNGQEVADWCGGKFVPGQTNGHGIWPDMLQIRTLEGVMAAKEEDYIIKGVQGEFYPCKPDIFKATYEPLKP